MISQLSNALSPDYSRTLGSALSSSFTSFSYSFVSIEHISVSQDTVYAKTIFESSSIYSLNEKNLSSINEDDAKKAVKELSSLIKEIIEQVKQEQGDSKLYYELELMASAISSIDLKDSAELKDDLKYKLDELLDKLNTDEFKEVLDKDSKAENKDFILEQSTQIYYSISIHYISYESFVLNAFNFFEFIKDKISNLPDDFINEKLQEIQAYIHNNNKSVILDDETIVRADDRQDNITLSINNEKKDISFIQEFKDKALESLVSLFESENNKKIKEQSLQDKFDATKTKDKSTTVLSEVLQRDFAKSFSADKI